MKRKTHFSKAPSVIRLFIILFILIIFSLGNVKGRTSKVQFLLVDSLELPRFPGSADAYRKFLEGFEVSPAALKSNATGWLIMNFIVEKDGSISHIYTSSMAFGSHQEALRLLKTSPKWVPGKINGNPAAMAYTLPILFNPLNQTKLSDFPPEGKIVPAIFNKDDPDAHSMQYYKLFIKRNPTIQYMVFDDSAGWASEGNVYIYLQNGSREIYYLPYELQKAESKYGKLPLAPAKMWVHPPSYFPNIKGVSALIPKKRDLDSGLVTPYFQGDESAWLNFMKGYKLPEKAALEPDLVGEVAINFIVEKDGSITNPYIAAEPGYSTGAEALRLIQTSPKWNPATLNGEAVPYAYTFKLRVNMDYGGK